MTKLLVVGKRGGILHWYEDVLSAAGKHANGFSLTHHNLTTRLAGHVLGKRHPQVRRMAHGDLATALTKSRPDLVIIIDLFYLEPAVNQLLKASGLPVVQWIGDRFENRLMHNTAVQHFFFTDTGLVDMAERLGLPSHYLPLAANAPAIPLTDWNARQDDILFIGAPSRNRVAMIESIHRPTLVIGPGWPTLSNPQARVSRHRISILQARRLYASCKFVLNVMNERNILNGLPQRCFDATLHGACLLTTPAADMPLNFADGKEILTFTSPEVIDQLASQDSKAAGIARAGRQRSQEEHTFTARIEQIMHTVFSRQSTAKWA